MVEEAFVKKCDRNLHNTPESKRKKRRLRRIERRNTVAGLREREKTNRPT